MTTEPSPESAPGALGSVPDAPYRTKAVYADPDTRFEVDETGEEYDPGSECVGWDLAFGCRINLGHNQAMDNELQVSVHVSDGTAKQGGETRKVTDAQLSDFAHRILVMLGEEPRGDQ